MQSCVETNFVNMEWFYDF